MSGGRLRERTESRFFWLFFSLALPHQKVGKGVWPSTTTTTTTQALVPQDSTIKGLSEPAKGVSPAPLPSTAFEVRDRISSPQAPSHKTPHRLVEGRSSAFAAKSSPGKMESARSRYQIPPALFSPNLFTLALSASRAYVHVGRYFGICVRVCSQQRGGGGLGRDPMLVVTFRNVHGQSLPMETNNSLPTCLWEM